ncbi:heme ABC exporter ATP-binding protein CcmA [Pseudemcibacter aquimaris]|uniref:heme ABC exporter ATP-binding protein CcmA n=1 Tax=Pseudemcibacter aquimaris TaxID=2857064 RepID=UPI0020118E64|nr:heme ABC exporter ATP-binding protein CcmA [Pseudemcibacter aquimaris]MCC3861946.1 heme ABC exporter ATP-binding protein CcmA [Pseudemcibacter aquimaris]WDU58698.1 heme ABC exporter ATP-binding protein CcmA [Pseudemcibacter aquimaris]
MKQEAYFSAENLTVSRSDRKVFENLTFQAPAGKLLKLVGPNGAGKSTLLKTLSGLIEPDTGDIKSGDASILSDHDWLSHNLCYLGHKNALKREFSVYDNIEFWADLWGTQGKIEPAIKALGIGYLSETPVRYLSSGQTRRTALARSICHPGKIWLFDEPTVGLDTEGLNLLAKVMENHLSDDGIILCATHVDLGLSDDLIHTLNLADFAVPYSHHEGMW